MITMFLQRRREFVTMCLNYCKCLMFLQRRSEPRYEASSVVLNGFVYLIGGYTECPNVPTRSCLKLSLSNPEEGWKEVASLTHGRRNAKTAVVESIFMLPLISAIFPVAL